MILAITVCFMWIEEGCLMGQTMLFPHPYSERPCQDFLFLVPPQMRGPVIGCQKILDLDAAPNGNEVPAS